MYWKRRILDYEILIPPISKPFNKFTEAEAKKFFEWYIAHIPQRIDYLEKKSDCRLDMTFESMIPLWRWFLKCAEIENTPRRKLNELKRLLKNNPMKDIILEDEKTQFSLQTEYILRDIGMYVGQALVTASNTLYWDYHTDIEQDSFANIPLVSGFFEFEVEPPFPIQFEPVHMVGVAAANLFDGTQKETDIFDLCNLWMDHVKKY